MSERATFRVKRGLAEMLKGGVIMDVVTPDEARIAEEAGAVAVMALERVPADIRRDGGVARMSDPSMIEEIQAAVTIPVMAKARIGHFAEAQVLQSLEVDYVDESEVLTPADEANHIDKHAFEVPFVCGATNLGEALRRIAEGAAMIRSKGEAGHRQHRRGRPPPARHHRRHQAAPVARRARSFPPPRRSCGAARDRRRGRRGRAGCPCRCSAPAASRRPADAALTMQLGAAGQLRRLRHLQVLRSRSAALGRSSRPPPTSRTRRASPPPRWASARRCAATTSPSSPPRASCSSTAESEALSGPARAARASRALRVGVLASQGDFAAHVRMLARARRRRLEVRTPAISTALDALVIPGGESTTIAKAIERDGLEPAIRAHHAAGRADPRHLRGDDPLRPQPPRAARRDVPAQRVRPPARRASRPTSRSRASARSRCAPSSSARPGSRSTGPGSRCWRASTGIRWSSARARCWPARSTPS